MFRCLKSQLTAVRRFENRKISRLGNIRSTIPSPSLNLISCCHFSTKSENENNERKPPKTSFFDRFSIEHGIKRVIHAVGLTNDEDLSHLIARTTKLGLFAVVGMTILGTIGIDTKPIVASLGVLGFAAGYALKDAASHLTAGFMLVSQKPFKKGDYVKILLAIPHEGIVEAIDVRYVQLRTKENNTLLIPCTVVYANSLVVSSKPPEGWLNPTPSPSNPATPASPTPTPPPPPPPPFVGHSSTSSTTNTSPNSSSGVNSSETTNEATSESGSTPSSTNSSTESQKK